MLSSSENAESLFCMIWYESLNHNLLVSTERE